MKTILIVEDSPLFAQALAKRLKSDSSYLFSIASSLSEAKTLVGTLSFMMAILDLTLPDAPDGEIVDYITSQNIPCIVFTGTFDPEMRKQILAKNVFDYVLKDSSNSIDTVFRSLERYFLNSNSAVLVVDDSSTSRKHIGNMLRKGHYTVIEAASGAEALKILANTPAIRLVITDYNMPEMDGFELVSHIRKIYSREHLAVIGVSSQADSALSAKFLKSGGNDFLAKPFFYEELHNKVLLNIELIERFAEIREQAERLALLNQ